MPRSTKPVVVPARDAVVKSELDRLGLRFPLWLFDPTSEAHPRKLDSIPANSRPAHITGWAPCYWEYGMLLEKADMERWSSLATTKLRPAEDAMKRILFDDAFHKNDYEAVLEGGSVFSLPDLSQKSGQSSRIERIRRKWDDVVLWDKAARFDALLGAEKEGFSCPGLAMKIENLQQLIQVAGIDKKNVTDVPVKAQFEFSDEEGGSAKGILYNGRFQEERGIIPTATKEYNDQFLRGTDREDELGTIGRSD